MYEYPQMYYRYTGYGVTGVDVFIWILLTAGCIGIPVLVLTICLLKKHYHEKRKSTHLIETESIFNSHKNINTLNNYLAQGSSNSRFQNPSGHTTDKNVRFKEDSFRPVISEPIPNPSLTVRQENMPDLRHLKQQLNNSIILNTTNTSSNRGEVTSNTTSVNINTSYPPPITQQSGHYEMPHLVIDRADERSPLDNVSRSSNSQRADTTAVVVSSADNFENLYSKVSVLSTVKSQPATSNQYVNPNVSVRFDDESQPVYINSNFEDA